MRDNWCNIMALIVNGNRTPATVFTWTRPLLWHVQTWPTSRRNIRSNSRSNRRLWRSSESRYFSISSIAAYYCMTHLLRRDDNWHSMFSLQIPQRCIYHHVILKDPSNVLKLYQHLRKRGGHASREVGWIYNLESKSWSVDAQILADLISLLPNLEVLSIDVGTTFAPEHLDEIFRVPRPNLISLNLVFRPYVETPTYYQFLKVRSLSL